MTALSLYFTKSLRHIHDIFCGPVYPFYGKGKQYPCIRCDFHKVNILPVEI
ncbi:hypothetical protein CLOHYLEM_04108 [[Clostridium] hylemonae DSM 15053]|uniref:Uncharacterized protein n=1 Tax=[Clostridium] hylemonae DSM 15053 TaxID=553973 RepID=C0BWE7_9FIRM|nr:hypothetical protein CLOHYLEM_04108 [[Clostridium] hylemonae DSM 15053]